MSRQRDKSSGIQRDIELVTGVYGWEKSISAYSVYCLKIVVFVKYKGIQRIYGRAILCWTHYHSLCPHIKWVYVLLHISPPYILRG